MHRPEIHVRRSSWRAVALAALLSGMTACGGGGGGGGGDTGGTTAPAPSRTPATIRLSQNGPISLNAGQTASVTATVFDASGNILPSAIVNWTSSNPAIVSVGGSGAATTLTAVGQPGTAAVQATSSGVTSAQLIVNVTGGLASRLTVTANGSQTRAAGDTALPLVVRVTDQFNNGVAGASVSWTTSGGTLQSPTTVSTTDGTTSNRLTIGSVAGSFLVTATVAGVTPVTFSLRVTAGAASQMVVGTPLPATIAVGSTAPISAIITDRFGNRVGGVPVAFTTTAGSSTVAPAAAVSDDNGVASSTVTIGRTSGAQVIQATATGVSGSPLSFTTTATAGPATALQRVGTDPAPVLAGTAFGDSIRVRVVDANGNGVSGVSVVFAIAAGGGSVNPAIAVTAADGIAATRWVSGPTAGQNTLVATSGTLTPVSYTATTTNIPLQPGLSITSPRVVFLDSGSIAAVTATLRDGSGATTPTSAFLLTARNSAVVATSGTVITGLRRGQSIVTASTGSALPDSMLAVVVARNGLTLQTDLTRLEVRPDETFTVTVLVDTRASGERIASSAITVSFDPSQLTYVSRSAGSSGAAPTVNDAQAATGRLALSFADAGGFTGRIELVRLTFRASTATGRTGAITLSASEINNTTFADLANRLTAVTYPLVIR